MIHTKYISYLLTLLLFSLTSILTASCSKSDSKGEDAPKATYTITFETNGGSTIDPITIEEGATSISVPGDPTKAGYTFKGWYIDKDLNTTVTQAASTFDFKATPISTNITLYAKWAEAITLTFQTGEGSAIASQSVEKGTKATKPTTNPKPTAWG